MSVQILIGDCLVRMKELADNSVDSVVCDPPYHLTSIVKRFGSATAAPIKNRDESEGRNGPYHRAAKGFMGQTWDGGDVAFRVETWAEVLRVLKPGGHCLAFAATRGGHRMATAIEDAGFELRDCLGWVFASGFPKSLNISKALDRMAGAEREVIGIDEEAAAKRNKRPTNDTQCTKSDPDSVGIITAPATDEAREWEGWGTALKPAWEMIYLARKPLSEKSIAANVLKWGTGALNIDGCRVEASEPVVIKRSHNHGAEGGSDGWGKKRENQTGDKFEQRESTLGRWPANLCHDGSDEVVAGFPADIPPSFRKARTSNSSRSHLGTLADNGEPFGHTDSGSAARFFYTAKASSSERGEGNGHPTVKPVSLMRWLVRLVTPKGGMILDPFAGSGSTLIAADAEQFNAIGIELSPEYAAIAERRVRDAAGMFAQVEIAA